MTRTSILNFDDPALAVRIEELPSRVRERREEGRNA